MQERRHDLVIGAISGYDFTQIRPWVRSLEQCGFRGRKVMIVYNAAKSVVDELVSAGFIVIVFEKDEERGYRFRDSEGEQILVSRFYHVWRLLHEPFALESRYVIFPDVKDLIFQTDPSLWLERNIGDKQLNVGSESVVFEDEPWGAGVLNACFEEPISRHMSKRVIYNAGTMAGTAATFRDFALQIYLVAAGRAEHPDQACANILLSLEPFRWITKFNDSEAGWACQAGTSIADSYLTGTRLPLTEPSPIIDGDTVFTNSGTPFCLVHQYDRIPQLREAILAKYSSVAPSMAACDAGRIIERPEWRLWNNSRGQHDA